MKGGGVQLCVAKSFSSWRIVSIRLLQYEQSLNTDKMYIYLSFVIEIRLFECS